MTPDPVDAPPGWEASSPGRFRAAAWWAVLRRVAVRALDPPVFLASAGIAFFAVLSVAPVLITALSAYAAVTTPEQAEQQLAGLVGVLPEELDVVLVDQLSSIAAASSQALTVSGLVALAAALWTATTAATYLLDAISDAYHEPETRPLLRRSGLALLLVLSGALLLGLLVTVATSVQPLVAGVVDPVAPLVRASGWTVLGGVMVLVLAVLYRVGPDRRRARWRWVTWGSVTATVAWVVASATFLGVVARAGTYGATYGSLAGVAMSMVWVFLTVYVVLLGAVVNAEAERQTAQDSTVGPARPAGRREAVVADSVPPYPGDPGRGRGRTRARGEGGEG